jgi:hypothetical protein
MTQEQIELINQLKDIQTYLNETKVPILGEFCIKYDYSEEEFDNDETLAIIKKMFERRKRVALERMIYSGELNATIGALLLKKWQETEVPKQMPAHDIPWAINLTPEESKQYHKLTHKAMGLGPTIAEQEEENAKKTIMVGKSAIEADSSEY